MASFAGPNLEVDGLVLCLDAANTNSYSGSGTTWTDISGQGNNGTLTNAPTFSNDNGGSIVFDGSDDYIQLPTNSDLTFTGDFSYETWLMTDTQLTSNHIWRTPNDKTFQFSNSVSPDQIIYYSSETGSQPFGVLDNNTWGHLILTKSGNTFTGYLNGVQAWTNTPGSSATHDFSGIRIGSRGSVSGFYWDGKFAEVRIYSKGLTASEVLQNYNSHKGRFSL